MISPYVAFVQTADTRFAPTLRELTTGDIDAIMALATQLDARDTADDWKARLRHGSHVISVGAFDDDVLVGCAAGEVRATCGLARAAWVVAFGVDVRQRGRGVGRSLATALLSRFRALGATHVYSLVPLHDRAAAPFYRELGFREEALVVLGRTL